MARLPAMVIPVAALWSLGACDTLGVHAQSDSLCGAQLGQPCTTIQDADGQGRAQVTFPEALSDAIASELSQEPLLAGKALSAAAGAPDGGAPYHVLSYRVPERLATAWIAPRLDDSGIFHEATFVHFVVREASWGRAPAVPTRGSNS